MPLIVLTGIPNSGKTTAATKIKTFLESKGKKVTLINEENMKLEKVNSYKDPTSEKITRAFLKSNVEKNLNKDDTVILDSMNYIKGYRYELFCLARNSMSTHCVVYMKCSIDHAAKLWENNKSDNKLTKELFIDYAERMEEPKLSNRWDTPLVTIRENDEVPLDLIFENLYVKEKKAKDPTSTKAPPKLSSSYLHDLDKSVQTIIDSIIEKQNELVKSNGGNLDIFVEVAVPNSKIHIKLPRVVTIPELKMWKMEFLKICNLNPLKNSELYGEAFTVFLNSASSRQRINRQGKQKKEAHTASWPHNFQPIKSLATKFSNLYFFQRQPH